MTEEPDDETTLTIYLRSGQTIMVPVTKWKISRDTGGKITAFTWAQKKNTPAQLLALDIEEVVAVVEAK